MSATFFRLFVRCFVWCKENSVVLTTWENRFAHIFLLLLAAMAVFPFKSCKIVVWVFPCTTKSIKCRLFETFPYRCQSKSLGPFQRHNIILIGIDVRKRNHIFASTCEFLLTHQIDVGTHVDIDFQLKFRAIQNASFSSEMRVGAMNIAFILKLTQIYHSIEMESFNRNSISNIELKLKFINSGCPLLCAVQIDRNPGNFYSSFGKCIWIHNVHHSHIIIRLKSTLRCFSSFRLKMFGLDGMSRAFTPSISIKLIQLYDGTMRATINGNICSCFEKRDRLRQR